MMPKYSFFILMLSVCMPSDAFCMSTSSTQERSFFLPTALSNKQNMLRLVVLGIDDPGLHVEGTAYPVSERQADTGGNALVASSIMQNDIALNKTPTNKFDQQHVQSEIETSPRNLQDLNGRPSTSSVEIGDGIYKSVDKLRRSYTGCPTEKGEPYRVEYSRVYSTGYLDKGRLVNQALSFANEFQEMMEVQRVRIRDTACTYVHTDVSLNKVDPKFETPV